MNSVMPIQQSHSSKPGFPLRLFAVAFVLSLLGIIFSGWQSWQMHNDFETMSRKHVALTAGVGRIMQFDEVLTMSARMAAATGDLSYEKRYDQFDPQLTADINEVRALLPQPEIVKFVGETDEANLALVKMERQAFALTHQGKRREATALLVSDEYSRLKKVYAGGMKKTFNAANGLIARDTQHLLWLSLWLVAANIVGVLVLLAAWFYAARSARRWAAERRESEDALQKAHDELEMQVERRTVELLVTNGELRREIVEREAAELRSQRLAQFYAVLSQCNRAIVHCTSEKELFPLICHDAVQFGGMKMVWIGLVDKASKRVKHVAAYGDGAEYLESMRFSTDANDPSGRGPVGTSMRENQPFWCQDFQNDPATTPWHESGARFGWGAVASIPLHRNGEVVGCFILHAGEANTFDEATRNLLLEMAMDISFALNNFEHKAKRKTADEALRASEQRLRTLIETEPECVKLLDTEGRLVEMNAAGLAMLEADSLSTAQQHNLPDFVLPEYRAALANLHQCVMRGETGTLEFEIVGLKGTRRWVETHAAPMRDHNGKVISLLGITRNITERKQSELLLQESEEKFHLLFDRSMDGILIIENNHFIECNQAAIDMMGCSFDEIRNTPPWMLSPPVQPDGRGSEEKAHEMMNIAKTQGRHRFEWVHRRTNGEDFPVEVTLIPIMLSGREVLYTTWRDITDNKKAEDRISQLANFDALTGLPNRILLTDRINQAISIAQRSGESLTLMFLDLDHFKNVNDSLGHHVGDELLIQLAKRLKALVRKEDTVSRLGGDEFIVVLTGADANGATHVAKKLLEVIAQPYLIEQYELIITPSIGMALYPHDGKDFDTLFKCADTAMYRSKQSGRNNYCFFTPEMQEHAMRTLQLENALRHAVEFGQLVLHYQPQVSLASGRVIGAEALVRWQHPEFGLVPPAEFIPISEETGQILQIGEWVLRTAIRQMKAWMDSGLGPMMIAVNLSSVQFRHLHLPELVTQILKEVQLPPEYLELELTESVAMDNPLAAIEVMNNLHKRGIRMAIDDFGTGYSSLSYLKRFQAYKLKIDQSFVRDITEDADDKAIVSAIISLAKSLGMKTIAEGVETEGQLAYLREQCCDEVQGYFYSKPLPADQFEAFVQSRLLGEKPGLMEVLSL